MSETVKPLTREQLREWYVEFVGPPMVQPAMGAQERRIEAHKRRVDRFVDGLWAFLEPHIAAERDLAQSREWRPIAEAPKDGTWLELAVISEAGIGYIEHGFFEVLTDDEDDGPWELRGGEPHCTYVGREAGTYWNCWFSVDEFETRYRVNKCKDFAKFTHFRKTTPPTTGSAP